MDGDPVYLASLSRWSVLTNNTVLVPNWPKPWLKEGIDILRSTIGPLGDKKRERVFRMNLTLCLHRALRPEEVARLPASFWALPQGGLAGGPVEILWENVKGALSTQPCQRPHKRIIPQHAHDLNGWIPIDCGRCPSCLARNAA